MSDEIKKPEVVNSTEEKQLDDTSLEEKSLEQVVGGKLYELTSTGKHISKVIIDR